MSNRKQHWMKRVNDDMKQVIELQSAQLLLFELSIKLIIDLTHNQTNINQYLSIFIMII